MHSCVINHIEYSLPSHWNELTRDQLLYVVRLFHSGMADLQLRILAVLSFLNLTLINTPSLVDNPEQLYYLKSRKDKPFLIDSAQVWMLAGALSFLVKEEKDVRGHSIKALNSSLSVNLLPIIRHKGISYHGVSDRLYTMTFGEYLEAEDHYHKYMMNRLSGSLDNLVATLYRKKHTNHNRPSHHHADPRESFDSGLVMKNASRLSTLDPVFKLAVLFFYQGCRKFLHNNFKNVFTFKGPGMGNPLATLNLVDALSGEDVTKVDSVYSALLYSVLARLERAATMDTKKTS